MPTAQSAGEFARASLEGKAFLELFPDAVLDASPDRCESEIGRGRPCDGTEHYDVTFTHRDSGTPPRETTLTLEIGRGPSILASIPSKLLVFEPRSCTNDSECLCTPCEGCFNVIHAPTKVVQAADCGSVACESRGCACRGGQCRTH